MAIPETPLTRIEQYLNRIATDDGVIPNVPLTRIEQYLNRIATKDGAIPEVPLTRLEQYLAKIAGEDVAVPNVPLTRAEQYLAKAAGQDVAVPEVPLTRTEQYLAEIAENGGGDIDIPIGVNLYTPEAILSRDAYYSYDKAQVGTANYGLTWWNASVALSLPYDVGADFEIIGKKGASSNSVLGLDENGVIRCKVSDNRFTLQKFKEAALEGERLYGQKIVRIALTASTSSINDETFSWIRTA